MSDPIVRTKKLGRDFGVVTALHALDLAVDAGTILTLLGPNGAGKTTLLRLVIGLIEPTRGESFVLGEPSRRLPAGVSAQIAYVGDRCEPPNWATPAMLESLQADASPTFDRALFRDYCKRRELSLNKPYGSLSKGQRRWVLTSLALACHPTLVLLDEPADGLDPAARKALYDSVRDHVNAEEATAIVTTHHIADVERIADEVAIIANGTLTLHAPLEDLRDRARLVETPDGTTPADLDGLVTLLGKAAPNGDRIVMLNRDITDDELRRQLGGNAEIRHVGLEELYLAVAGQT